MELLRIITAGSVDDGKSTLIGRLFYDSRQLLADQVSALEFASKKKGKNEIDFSLLTDGLKEERERGITIDVAYRYMTTARRKYILADTPGHLEYTRNFVTACSNSDIALLMIDVTKGMQEQTRRHAYIASMMGLRKLIFCINKMDAVNYSEDVFNSLREQIHELSGGMSIPEILHIPVSALHGDNIVSRSGNMAWYGGMPLLEYLDTAIITRNSHKAAVMPVQTVIKGDDNAHAVLTCAGRITSGTFTNGEPVVVLPSGLRSSIRNINKYGEYIDNALSGESVSLQLTTEVSIARGNVIATEDHQLIISKEITALICWLSEQPLQLNRQYMVRHATLDMKGTITGIQYKVNVEDFSQAKDVSSVTMNDIFCARLSLSDFLTYDRYASDKNMGAFILVDAITYNTVAAGTIS